MKAISEPPVTHRNASQSQITADIEYYYPEMADLLICMVKKESDYGKNMVGDHGLAIGYFQIHIDKHPVSYTCAMDLKCSLDYTVKMIKQNKGFLWTTFEPCRKLVGFRP